ncbi:hypothetical protein GJ496_009211 [Pomphorhynchus laevis]|nr:hypothetical protein GJ496_009211 [Pomphorhynchus laevis]
MDSATSPLSFSSFNDRYLGATHGQYSGVFIDATIHAWRSSCSLADILERGAISLPYVFSHIQDALCKQSVEIWAALICFLMLCMGYNSVGRFENGKATQRHLSIVCIYRMPATLLAVWIFSSIRRADKFFRTDYQMKTTSMMVLRTIILFKRSRAVSFAIRVRRSVGRSTWTHPVFANDSKYHTIMGCDSGCSFKSLVFGQRNY